MDSTLNDFFNEINKITPVKKKQKKTECVWQECFDESSGYTYYWNTVTDEVTWEMPETYRLWKEKANRTSLNLYIPPQTSSFDPSNKVQKNLMIYKISECKGMSVQRKEEASNKSNNLDNRKKQVECEKIKPCSENRKVVLVPSYELESESEEDDHFSSSSRKSPDCEKRFNIENNKSEEYSSDKCEVIISIKESKHTEISKQLNHEIYEKPEENQSKHYDEVQNKTEMGELSLVAGYGNSEKDIQGDEVATSINENEKNINTIDLKNLIGKNSGQQQTFHFIPESILHHKKKRINLENTTAKQSTPIPTGNDEYAGLGYNDSNKSLCYIKKKFMGFKSGGILFVGSDIPLSNNVEKGGANSSTCEEESKCKMLQDIEETSQTLSEKLRFLTEGREPICAVQTLFIQMETLNAALKANSLSPKYLFDWLQDTCSELVKLEQSAAPTGWSLQWDRPNKRYFYYNQKTGENQWEYPQPNVIRSDEAMDICTTPPPPSEEIFDEQSLLLPSVLPEIIPIEPPPPTISKRNSPSPPPPPYISQHDNEANNEISESKEPSKSSAAEPPPPGVDCNDSLKSTHSNNQEKTLDALGQELNSFYSDIAALEGQISMSEKLSQSSDLYEIDRTEEAPKRKKRKMKIAEGLSLKKKGVSKLVEKWKNVQKDLNSSNQ